MLNSTKRLLAKFSTIDKGPEKLECSRGSADFRSRPGDFVAWKLSEAISGLYGTTPGPVTRQALLMLVGSS